MLSCSCDIDINGSTQGVWWYFGPTDFSIFRGTKKGRRKRCVSCKELINIGELCVKFERARDPYTDIEFEICGNKGLYGIPMPPLFMCERCGEIYLNLSSAGYCIQIGGDSPNMDELLAEYHKITGFQSKDEE